MSETALAIIPLEIEVRGEVITSNAAAFREWVRESIARINTELTTDEEFSQAENDAKGLKEAEGALKAAKEKALRDAEQLHALFTELDETSEELREARLKLERQIKAKKQEIVDGLVRDALERLPADLSVATRQFEFSFREALKGKRTLVSMKKSLSVAEKSAIGLIEASKSVLDKFESDHGRELIMDRREWEVKRPDQVEAELQRRLDVKRAEDERRKAEEEARKARAEAAEAKRKAEEEARPPAPTPPPAPVVSAPQQTDTKPDAASEWQTFEAAMREAFHGVKAARERLQHVENVERAQNLADRFNAAWREVTA